MWRLQFLTSYDLIAFSVAVGTLLLSLCSFGISYWSFTNQIPTVITSFSKKYYEHNWTNRSNHFQQLSSSTIDFLKGLSQADQRRIEYALNFFTFITPPSQIVDLANQAKTTATVAVIPFPDIGPFFGDGQFTIESEMEFLIDKGLVRQIPGNLQITPSVSLDLFTTDRKMLRLTSTSNINMKVYVATSLARELLLFGNEQTNRMVMIQRLHLRIAKDRFNIFDGNYEIKTNESSRWIEPQNLQLYRELP